MKSGETDVSSWSRPGGLGTTAAQLQGERGFSPAALPPGREVKSLDPVIKGGLEQWHPLMSRINIWLKHITSL